jgi:hypothetical protein
LSCMYERSIYHGRNMFVVHKNMTREKEREKERKREREIKIAPSHVLQTSHPSSNAPAARLHSQ